MIKVNETKDLGRVFHYNAYVEGTVIGAKEVHKRYNLANGTEVKDDYIEIAVMDECGNAFYLKDKTMNNLKLYKRDEHGVFELIIEINETYNGRNKIYVNGYIANNEMGLLH